MSLAYNPKLLEKVTLRGLLVDTGPLVIHAVGCYDNKRLPKVSDAKTCHDEFRFVERVFSVARKVFVTPYVLSEMSSIVKIRLRLEKRKVTEFEDFVDRYKHCILAFGEVNVQKESIVESPCRKFGFTDASLVAASREVGIPILIKDIRLGRWCEKRGLEVIWLHGFFDSLWRV